MARKAVKKAVKRAAPAKKQYVVGWTAERGNEPDFLTGMYDTIDMAKKAAEESYDDEDQFFIYEVKLVAQSEAPVPVSKLNWKSK